MIDKPINEISYIIIPLTAYEDERLKLDEITSLTQSAGASIYGVLPYIVREINPATYIGSGKLSEVCDELEQTDVNLVVFDGELSPSQTVNMSNALGGIKVIDRTTLILDIFASNAVTAEGKTQIELAQLKYIYPRLKGKGQALSRLGGGIGTRGPGETKLETDRRHIRARINALEEKLKDLEQRRSLQSARRSKNSCKTVALVGYTNTGKSTLLNALTNAGVLAKDKLFATLDPTVKKLKLDDFEVLVVDTVGFVRNIPHHIIEAFKSTLEFASNADLILNVCDGSGNWQNELQTAEETLASFENKPKIITVINKCDKITDFTPFPRDALFISAKSDVGLDKLMKKLNEEFASYYTKFDFTLPYEKVSEVRKIAHLADKIDYEYRDADVRITASVPKIYEGRFFKVIQANN